MLVRMYVHDVIESSLLQFCPLFLSSNSMLECQAALQTAFPTENASFHDLDGPEGSYSAIFVQMIRYFPECFQGDRLLVVE